MWLRVKNFVMPEMFASAGKTIYAPKWSFVWKYDRKAERFQTFINSLWYCKVEHKVLVDAHASALQDRNQFGFRLENDTCVFLLK